MVNCAQGQVLIIAYFIQFHWHRNPVYHQLHGGCEAE